MRTKPFQALTPKPDQVAQIASVPYDVVNTEEARALAAGKPDSFLHVLRAEIDFPPNTDPYSDPVYAKARENFDHLQASGALVREPEPCLYLYRQVWNDHTQTGVALTCHIDDYANDIIRKHEKTRPVKENDRTRLNDTLSANPGPVFLTYKDHAPIDTLVNSFTSEHEPRFHFTDEAGVTHIVWRVAGISQTKPFIEAFEEVSLAYVADGHHRSASAHRVGSERRSQNSNHTGKENYNWFLNVLFPASQLKILPYNRIVKDLNGLDKQTFLAKLADNFSRSDQPSKFPPGPHAVSMYLDGTWSQLAWPEPETNSPIQKLDAAVLQDRLLSPILGIGDPRTDNRIDFVGGIRGPEELKKRVDSGDWAVAFSMAPVTVEQLIAIADAGEIMPPKSTWFEPKLRSGLFVYTLDE
ncbi:MAG: DUF1015 family protein [Verrucomicrobiota bacterium]